MMKKEIDDEMFCAVEESLDTKDKLNENIINADGGEKENTMESNIKELDEKLKERNKKMKYETFDELKNENFNYLGINYKLPIGYHAYSNEGLIKDIIRRGKLVDELLISRHPVIITSILNDFDTGDMKVEITDCTTGKKVIANRSTVYSASKLVGLADKGLLITSNTAKYLVDYLSDFESINEAIIPKRTTINRLGWIDDKTFIPYNKNNFELDINDSSYTWVKALNESGTLNEWVETMKPLRNNNVFRFILATSFAAPLLKLTDTRSFVVYNWASSKGGKTAAAYCAISVWGQAESLKVSFDATKVGIEGLSEMFSDLPILIDEKQIDNNQNKVEGIIYLFANGKSKLRGTQSGGIQKNSKWRAIAIATGEEPLSDDKSQDGVRSRIIELYNKPFDNEETASSMYPFTQNHYGVAGKQYITSIIKTFSNYDYKPIKKMFEIVKAKLKKLCPEINFAQLSYFSVVTLADMLIGQIFFQTDTNSSMEMSVNIIKDSLERSQTDMIDYAFNFISEWILSNHIRFSDKFIFKETEKDNEAIETYVSDSKEPFGIHSGDIYYFFPTKIKFLLNSNGYNSEKILRGFKERGYIMTDNKNTNEITVSFEGEKRKFVAFKLHADKEIHVSEEELKKRNEEVFILPKIYNLKDMEL